MNMFNFMHLMTFLTVVSLKCGAKVQLLPNYANISGFL